MEKNYLMTFKVSQEEREMANELKKFGFNLSVLYRKAIIETYNKIKKGGF